VISGNPQRAGPSIPLRKVREGEGTRTEGPQPEAHDRARTIVRIAMRKP
jgi:hypothetical protein